MPERAAALAALAVATLTLAAAPSRAAEAPLSAATPAAMEKLSLQEAVARALARNPTVLTAAAEIARADALVQQARAPALPTVVGNATYTRLDDDRVRMGQVIAHANQFSGNVQVTVPLLAPQAWANTSQAKSTRRATEAAAAEVRREVAQATARAYLTVVAQHRLVAATETARATAQAHFEYAHTRLQGGVGHSIDEVRAQQDLATIDVRIQTVYTALARAREALGVLMGGSGPVDSVDEVNLGPTPGLQASLDEARTRRTDVRAEQRRVAASQKRVDDRWVYYAPYLAAVGQPFVQEPASLLTPERGWQAQLLLTLPIYDGGLRAGIIREREALLAEARASLEGTLRQAESEVRIGFEAMLRADQGLTAARDAVRLAHRATELATLAYRAGATGNLEVIDAARAERDADVAAAQAEDVARQARLDLLVAAGRFP